LAPVVAADVSFIPVRGTWKSRAACKQPPQFGGHPRS